MAEDAVRRFGTAPVFLSAAGTILGALLFLRFGYAVGNIGLLGGLGLILIGHLATVPTGPAIAEMATNRKGERDLAMVVKGVLFLMPRRISQYYGFGSFIHFIPGPPTAETSEAAGTVLGRLIHQDDVGRAGMYVDTIISPSFKTGVAKIVQFPGIAGTEDDSILFEFRKEDADELQGILEGRHFAPVVGFNACILRSSDKHFGYRRDIDIWLTAGDIRNANLLIILASIMIGHPDSKHAEARLYAAFSPKETEAKKKRLLPPVRAGQEILTVQDEA